VTRRLLGILVLAISAVGAAAAAAPMRQIPLAAPAAQSVAIDAVKLAGVDTNATLRLSSTAAPQATALVARKANTIFAIVVNRAGGKASLQLGSVPGSASLALKTLADVGAASPGTRSAFSRSVGTFLGWNPLASPNGVAAPGVTVRVYDAQHPAGRPVAPGLAVQAVADAGQLLQALTASVRDDLYKQIDETSACILGRLTCGKYVFSFKGLQETIVRSDDPSFKLTTHYTGATCGRTMLGQPWRITTQSGSDPPVTHTVDLRKRNDVFTTVAKVKGVGSGTAIHKLGPQPGAFPAMQALVDSTGVWSSNAGGQTVPVSVTSLPAGKSC
jgi:hypothetical protein